MATVGGKGCLIFLYFDALENDTWIENRCSMRSACSWSASVTAFVLSRSLSCSLNLSAFVDGCSWSIKTGLHRSKMGRFPRYGPENEPRNPAFPPVLTRYKLLEIERQTFVSSSRSLTIDSYAILP